MSAGGGELSYRALDAELRGAWRACGSARGGATVAELAEHGHIPRSLALKVWLLREGASLELLALWTSGALTSKQALRIAMDFAYDEDAQREAASSCSSVARMRLARSSGSDAP